MRLQPSHGIRDTLNLADLIIRDVKLFQAVTKLIKTMEAAKILATKGDLAKILSVRLIWLNVLYCSYELSGALGIPIFACFRVAVAIMFDHHTVGMVELINLIEGEFGQFTEHKCDVALHR